MVKIKHPLNRQSILKGILDGYEIAASHPCSVCRGGLEFKKFPHFHGTDFGKCLRAVQYGKIMERTPIDRLKRPHLADGHLHEAATVMALRAAGFEVDYRQDSETGVCTDEFIAGWRVGATEPIIYKDIKTCRKNRTDDEVIIVGHTDGRINGRIVLEHKAVEKYAFEQFSKGKTNPAYEAQTKCYITHLDCEAGVLVVKWREKAQFCKPFWIPRDDLFIRERVDEFRQITNLINKQQWAPCTPIYPGEQRWCDACKVLGKVSR